MEFHKDNDPSETFGRKSHFDDYDTDSFLSEQSLEDRLTAALDGKDILSTSPAEPFVPKYPSDPNHGRHEAPEPTSTDHHPTDDINYNDDFWNEGSDPRFDAPQRPKVVVQDPYEQQPVYVTPPIGVSTSAYPPTGGGTPTSPHNIGDSIYDDYSKKKGHGGIVAAILGVVAAIVLVVLVASLLKGTRTKTETEESGGAFVINTTIPAGKETDTSAPSTATPVSQATATPGNETQGKTYTITAAAGAGGEISPSGKQTVREGESITFTVIANAGCQISDVQVDGISVDLDSKSRITFDDVDADHTLNVTFTQRATDTPAPTAVPVVVTATPAPTSTPEPTEVPVEETPAPVSVDDSTSVAPAEYDGAG